MLTNYLLQFALIGAEWVLWVLVILSFINVYIMIERAYFYFKRSIDIHDVRIKLEKMFREGKFDEAAEVLKNEEAMEAKVVLFGLRSWDLGDHAVQDLMSGALATERTRYDRGLGFLGTVGNNAPFIGLFGTVLGVIGAFRNLGSNSAEASAMVMHAISEALVATGVGLLVAIPAVIAFNIYKSRVKKSVAQTELLGSTLLSQLRNRHDDLGNV